MRKTLVLSGLIIALALPGLTHAQESAEDKLSAIKPQLVQLATSVNAVVPVYVQAQVVKQDNLLDSYSLLLQNLSLSLASNPAPTNAQLTAMSGTVANIQAQANAMAQWRAHVNVVVSDMVVTLGNISNIIASIT